MGRAFTVALLLALAIVALWWQLAEKRVRELDRAFEQAEARADSLEQVHAVLLPESGGGVPAGRGDSEQEVARLRGLGLSAPLHQIRASLAGHPRLIPFEGVLGGTMFFDTSSVVLSRGSAHARFEDGHVTGHGTFEYEVQDGRITWKRVVATLD